MNNDIFLRAFSLIELLLVLILIGISSVLLIPCWHNVIERNRAEIFIDELSANLRLARAYAIKMDESIIFCGSRSSKFCDGDWSKGQILITKGGKLLRVMPKIFAGDQFIWQGSANAKDKLIFSKESDLGEQRGHFYYCPKGESDNAVGLILESTGRSRVIYSDFLKSVIISCNL